MDLNKEEVLQQLQNFGEGGSDGVEKLSDVLEEYLRFVAKTGDVLYPWCNVKPLMKKKLELVLDEFHEKHPLPALSQPFNYQELRKEILMSLDSFTGAPFTIQRICELLTLPTKHYKRTDKFMRGLEKNVLVVSHIDPKHSPADDQQAIPPKSIFAAESSYHVFERSLNHSDLSGSPSAGPSSSSASSAIDDSFRNRESFLSSDQPGTSSAGQSSSSSSSSSKIILPSLSCPNPQTPAPLQQLDSFTTVFSSPPSTPLAVVSNMPPFDPTSSSSSSSSSGSSGESSPQADGGPASPPENAEGHSFDSRSSFSDRSSSESSHSNPAPDETESHVQENDAEDQEKEDINMSQDEMAEDSEAVTDPLTAEHDNGKESVAVDACMSLADSSANEPETVMQTESVHSGPESVPIQQSRDQKVSESTDTSHCAGHDV